jgi:tetratricopeptide (TPR) repeat protein
MATIAEALAMAIKHHEAGNLAQAEQIYLVILQAEPGHGRTLELLGMLAHQQGQYERALGYGREAVARAPGRASSHVNLALVYQTLGRLAEAEACYRQALILKPDMAEAHNNLGNTLNEQGRMAEAQACYQEALRQRPDYAEAHNNLGHLLEKQGWREAAEACYRQAVRLRPNYPEAHFNLGNVFKEGGRLHEAVASFREALRHRPAFADACYNLANTLKEQGRVDEAIGWYREALRLRPDFPGALNNLGNALKERGRLDEAVGCYQAALRQRREYPEAHFNLGTALAERRCLDEAIACFREALRLRPEYPDAHNNLGNAFRDQGQMREAETCYLEAVRLRPEFAGAHNNLGVVLVEQGRFDEAEACYQEALRVRPEYHEARFHLGNLYLLRGDFARGWPRYEWRWETKTFTKPSFAQPRWDGSDLGGRTVLLHTEQGLGDTLQFIRYASLVRERGGRVIVQCHPALRELLEQGRRIDAVLSQGAPLPAFDVYAPLLSVPGLLGTRLEDVPATVPYLAAQPERIERWRSEIERLGPGLRVGIAWQGNPIHRNDRRRSVPLAQFEPLAGVAGVQLVSLQVGPGSEQLSEVTGLCPVADLASRFDRSSFADAAAALCGLDLLVSVDTALVHLAGALGRPVWVALPFAPDWRWLLDREDSPWYPTMRLFRQRVPGEWAEVFERMAAALRQLSSCRKSRRAATHG